MDEYIKRKSLIDEFDRLGLGEHSLVERVFSDGVRTVIAGIPAADVAPVVHGRWIEHSKYTFGTMYDCSICANRILDNGHAWNYCPNCGARMDGDAE